MSETFIEIDLLPHLKISRQTYSASLSKMRLDRLWENGLVFKIARAKTHQNFLASKYDIKQHSDAT